MGHPATEPISPNQMRNVAIAFVFLVAIVFHLLLSYLGYWVWIYQKTPNCYKQALHPYSSSFLLQQWPGSPYSKSFWVPCFRQRYRVSQKKHFYKIFGLEIMLFTCSQTLWSGLRSSFTKWGTAPAFTTACKTTMSASRWRAWSLVQKFYKSVFSGTPCSKKILLEFLQRSPEFRGNGLEILIFKKTYLAGTRYCTTVLRLRQYKILTMILLLCDNKMIIICYLQILVVDHFFLHFAIYQSGSFCAILKISL